jgi:predicted nucleotidyltransferase
VQRILKKHIREAEVWVFGSRIKNTNKDYSDLDLVVVGKSKQDLSTLGALEEDFEESDLPFEVDILDYMRVAEHIKKEIDKSYVKFDF